MISEDFAPIRFDHRRGLHISGQGDIDTAVEGGEGHVAGRYVLENGLDLSVHCTGRRRTRDFRQNDRAVSTANFYFAVHVRHYNARAEAPVGLLPW